MESFNDFGRFFATRIRIRFNEADPDPADQNETDPNGSGSATLELKQKFVEQMGEKIFEGVINI